MAADLLALYRRTLLDDVLPFWVERAIDATGSITTCITDDGRVVSRDRWGWSQWRGVWLFAALYNRLQRRPEWLRIARGICAYMRAHGPDGDGHWPLLLDDSGAVARGFESVYVDQFAIYGALCFNNASHTSQSHGTGLVELYRATRDSALLSLALQTFRAVEACLSAAAPPPAWPYPIPAGRVTHGVSMMMSLVCHELAAETGDAAVRRAAEEHHTRVMSGFLQPGDDGLVLEWLSRDTLAPIPGREGAVVIPGHAIESLWFQMHVNESVRTRAARGILRHLDAGWDVECGGLYYAIDAAGHSDVAWRFPDAKLWWPHVEALYATLLAHEALRGVDDDAAQQCLTWHDRVREYAFRVFPHPGPAGEWRQKLDRRGQPLDAVVALPVKDPFHLPRALLLCIGVLERLVASQEQ